MRTEKLASYLAIRLMLVAMLAFVTVLSCMSVRTFAEVMGEELA